MPASSRPWSDVTRLVIDNGGHTCKVGFAGEDKPTKCMFNGLVKSKSEHKVFVGDQLDNAQDLSSLQYRLSLERGCLVNWDTQAEVWARAFGPDVLKVNPADCSLLVSECPMCPNAIQDTMDEMLFEHFRFHSYCSRPAPALARVLAPRDRAAPAGAARARRRAARQRPARTRLCRRRDQARGAAASPGGGGGRRTAGATRLGRGHRSSLSVTTQV